MKHFSHLNTAVTLLNKYDGAEPFASFLKEVFRANKKYGSKDRKRISQLCYGFFRLGQALRDLPIEKRVLLGLLFSSSTTDELLQHFHPEWDPLMQVSIKDKIVSVLPSFDSSSIFPFTALLSEGIEADKFAVSHLIQPAVYLRLRPGFEETVLKKLDDAKIVTERISAECLALPNSSKLEELIVLNKEAVVQDKNSQRVAQFFPNIDKQTPPDVWDCCAASGGKSIMVYDWNTQINLTVTDIRESILANLRKRFSEAGVKKYNSKLLDLTQRIPGSMSNAFDLVIADLPCTGSGTWGRTPEQLFFFNEEKIKEYSGLQRNILTNIYPAIKPGGYLLFITCSVFREENEDNAVYIRSLGLQLLQMELLKGYDEKADTMFAALFQKLL